MLQKKKGLYHYPPMFNARNIATKKGIMIAMNVTTLIVNISMFI